jgi:ribosomal protein S18 acetylase RimI-like enzyme
VTEILEKLITQAVDIYDFRPMVAADIEAAVELYGEYFAESFLPGLGLSYDPKKAWALLYKFVSTGNNPHLLATEKKTGKLIGVVAYNINHDYTTEPFAILYKLYVRPKWRKSPVARILMTLCLEIARADNAVAFHLVLTSGMAETRSAVNLFLKLGFETTDGITMMRRL